MSVMQRVAFLVCSAFALAVNAGAAPSFGCTKADTASEKTVCAAQSLQWLDRQAAQLYAAASSRQAAKERTALVRSQRDFLLRREACMADAQRPAACLEQIYIARLYALGGLTGVYEAFAEYTPPKDYAGALWIARYPFTASVYLSTARTLDGRECRLEFDGATKGGKGVIRWRVPASTLDQACRLNLIPEGDDVRIESKGCALACGQGATTDGGYLRKK